MVTPAEVAQFAGNYYVAVKNPRWVNSDKSKIVCEVNFNHVDFEEWTPFCADPNDYMPYSKMIFDECIAGQWGTVAEYVPPSPDEPRVIEPAPNQPQSQGAQQL